MKLGIKAKTGLGLVVAYTAYSTYVHLRTHYEINDRLDKKLKSADFGLISNVSLRDGIPPSVQFRPMVVGGKFVNPFSQYRHQTLFEFVYCNIVNLFHLTPRGGLPKDPLELKKLLPSVTPDFALLSEPVKQVSALIPWKPKSHVPKPQDRITLTWIGQSCAFVQLGGLNILTDPFFGDHLVTSWMGPQRLSKAPCQLEDLPKVDIVLVSHDHPDHLEVDTVKKIGNSALWVVPLGVKRFLAKYGIYNVAELNWWESMGLETPKSQELGEKWTVACTPAMHWSGRKMYDANSTLWGSFMVMKDGKPHFFHAGDTGYSPELFRGIKEEYGPGCKLAMLPCGAYKPRWHLKSQHIDPQEAVSVMKDLEAKNMVGVHWGTFILSDEKFTEPRDSLHKIAEDAGVGNSVLAPKFGQTLVFDTSDGKGGSHPPEEIRDGKALLFR